jgi:hypothetical protein
MQYKKMAIQMAAANECADTIYKQLVSIAGLFGHAFFGFKATKQERQKLNYLWKLALSVSYASEYHFTNGTCDNVEHLPTGERKFSKI